MRDYLRRFLIWLDKRFPERVVVTQASYAELEARVAANEALMVRIMNLEEKMKKVDGEISKFNVSLGFAGSTIRAQVGPWQR